MNWWSAKNLCQAHGKQMVTMSDLGIQDQTGKTNCYFDHSKPADKTLTCTCSGDDTDCSQTKKALYTFSTGGIWLADNNGAACVMSRINIYTGRIDSASRASNFDAFCR